jgi:AcrR family transcriptional regulator
VARTVGSSAPQTRRRILEAAAEVFAEHGYAGASMRDIAERLGITKAALYYHFASKEDLLDGLVQPIVEALADFAQAAESGRHAAPEMLRRFLDLMIDGVSGLYALMADPGARDAIKARHHPMELTRRIETLLAGDDDPDCLLRWQFVLGGIRSLVLSRLINVMRNADGSLLPSAPGSASAACATRPVRPVLDDVPLFSEAECEVVVETALAGLGGTA